VRTESRRGIKGNKFRIRNILLSFNAKIVNEVVCALLHLRLIT